MNVIRTQAAKWQALFELKDDLEQQMDVIADAVEYAAHVWLKKENQVRRAGQWPTLVSVAEGGCGFNVTNNIDADANFFIYIVWEDLEGRPEELAVGAVWNCSQRCWQEGGPHDENCHETPLYRRP